MFALLNGLIQVHWQSHGSDSYLVEKARLIAPDSMSALWKSPVENTAKEPGPSTQMALMSRAMRDLSFG